MLPNAVRILTLCLLLGLTAILTGCGYQPLHGQRQSVANTAIDNELAHIWIYEIEDREGQLLHNELISLFNPKGRPAHPKYKMKVNYAEGSSGLSISKSDFATRANFNVNVSFTLSGPESMTGNSNAVVSYNILTSPTGTEFAKRDARLRAIKKIADDIHRRVAVHMLNSKSSKNPE